MDLPTATERQKQEVFDLLNGVMYGRIGYEELERFLRERVISL